MNRTQTTTLLLMIPMLAMVPGSRVKAASSDTSDPSKGTIMQDLNPAATGSNLPPNPHRFRPNGTSDPYHCIDVKYFSGTCCEYVTGVYSSGAHPPTITNAYITISGTVSGKPFSAIIAYTGPTGTTSWSQHYRFDSTYFDPNTIITGRVDGYFTDGGHATCSVWAPAKNRALIDLYPALGPGDHVLAHQVDVSFQHMHHSTIPSSSDTAADIFHKIPSNSAFYIDTHGNTGGVTSPGRTAPGTDVNYWDVTWAVSAKNRSQPPYNFVFLDACNTAGDTYGNTPISEDLSQAWLNGVGVPVGQIAPSYGADRAFLGWQWEIRADDATHKFVKGLFASLEKGMPVGAAVTTTAATTPPHRVKTFILGFPWGTANTVPKIYGDTATQLRGVYLTGSKAKWYILLP